jgi:phage terminase large subunit GpA-like protein
MFASAADVRRGVAEMFRPPQRISVSESAAANLRIVNPSGSSGNWSADVAPYMVEPMNLARSRLYEAIVFVGPARSGKTIALVDGVIAYSIVDDPADCLVVQTSQGTAEDFSKTRISRAISGSPELAKRLSPRAHDDNVLLKFFRSGMALRFGWPSLGQLSGKDLRRVLLTDVDNFTGDLSIDEAFGLALKRVQTYMSAGVLVAESSPAKDYADGKWRPKTLHEGPPADGIASLYNRGDRRRWYWPCPECRQPFQAEPGIEGFALPPVEDLLERVLVEDVLALAEQHSLLHCPHCGVGIEPKWKRSMNAAGRWVADGQQLREDGTLDGEAPRSRTASFWLGGVAAAYQSWTSLVERYLQAVKHYAATGEQRALKTTVNVDQAMSFRPLTSEVERNAHELQERVEDWPEQTVPPGVRFLTGQIDIQAGKTPRFVVQVYGWGVGLEKWTVDRFALKSSLRPTGEVKDGAPAMHPIDPAAYLEDWDRLIEKVIERRYQLADGSGRSMPVRLAVCDSGGKDGVTQRAYDFWRSLKTKRLQHKFLLVKGAASPNAPRVQVTYPDSRGRNDSKSGARGDVPVLQINTTTLKDAVAADLARTARGPGYFHFARWLPLRFFEELTAETRGAKGWAKDSNRRANEAFDLTVYGQAAAIHLRADRINWSAPPPWADEWDRNPDVLRDGAPPVPVAKRKLRVARSAYLER